MVLAGSVRVNGKIPESAGIEIDPERDVVEIDGKRVLYDVEKIYILLNKLPGYLSAAADTRGEPTIMDLIPETGKRLYPIGRLDKDTEGLIIITNDGDLTHRLTHPGHNVNKVYQVWVNGNPTDESLDKLCGGIMLEDGMTAPAIVERVKSHNITSFRMTIHEGRKRQIKRMFQAIGHMVIRLRRIQLGPIELGNLPPGKYRYLTQEEIKLLRECGE